MLLRNPVAPQCAPILWIQGSTDMHKKQIAIGYPRVSTDRQEQNGYSLQDQVKQIEDFCAENNIELRAHFLEVESAKTASKRPVFKAALSHMHYGEIDLLVCTNFDRFARNVVDSETIRQSLARKGKKIISTQQRYLTPLHDLVDDDEELTAAIQHAAIDNERERKKIAKRMRRGRDRKISEGGWGGHRPPYEFDVVRGELSLNKERAWIVRLMIRLRKLKRSYRQIADYLNGNNKLFDPMTRERGRKFEPPHMLQPHRKRMKKLLIGNGDWHPGTVWRVVGRYEVTETNWDKGVTLLNAAGGAA